MLLRVLGVVLIQFMICVPEEHLIGQKSVLWLLLNLVMKCVSPGSA